MRTKPKSNETGKKHCAIFRFKANNSSVQSCETIQQAIENASLQFSIKYEISRIRELSSRSTL